MDKSSKILFGGVICAMLIAGCIYANTLRMQSKLHKLESKCVEDDKKPSKYDALAIKFGGKRALAICDASTLIELNSELETAKGIQLEIVRTQKELISSNEYIIPLLISVVFAIPWAWYFFLRRVRELHDAITGK